MHSSLTPSAHPSRPCDGWDHPTPHPHRHRRPRTTHFAALKSLAASNNHLRLGLLTNQSGLDSDGHRTIDLLAHAYPPPSPQSSPPSTASPPARTPNTSPPKPTPPPTSPSSASTEPKPADRHPTHAQLDNLDAVVIDLQDAGVHFWTYEAAAGYFLEAAAPKTDYPTTSRIILLDRPNLVGGVATQGPVSDPGTESYINYMPAPRPPRPHLRRARQIRRRRHKHLVQTHLDRHPHAELDAAPSTSPTPASPGPTPAPTSAPPTPPSSTPPSASSSSPTSPSAAAPHTPSASSAPAQLHDPAWFKAADVARPSQPATSPASPSPPPPNHRRRPPSTTPSTARPSKPSASPSPTPPPSTPPSSASSSSPSSTTLYPTQFKLARDQTLLCNAATLAALRANTDPRSIAATWTHAPRKLPRRNRPLSPLQVIRLVRHPCTLAGAIEIEVRRYSETPEIFHAVDGTGVHSLIRVASPGIEEPPMPRINFQQQLAALKDKLLAMAALSQQALEFSVEAYLNRDSRPLQARPRASKPPSTPPKPPSTRWPTSSSPKSSPWPSTSASSSPLSRSTATSSASATSPPTSPPAPPRSTASRPSRSPSTSSSWAPRSAS